MSNSVQVKQPIKFEKMFSSWVAIHPNPKGVIQFIGGAFYGSTPTMNYRYFLSKLFEAGYTIIALPFRFTFRHWNISLQLLEEHYLVRQAIVEAIMQQPEKANCAYSIYLKSSNYYWIGHSLGCKYIVLLEVLNDGLEKIRANAADIGIEPSQYEQIETRLHHVAATLNNIRENIQQQTNQLVDFDQPSIHNEASLLIAPVIADLDAAIPLRSLRRGLNRLGVEVLPTIEQTYSLITRSNSFNLMQTIEFSHDKVAKQTCIDLAKALNHSSKCELNGKHLEPVGLKIGSYVADFNPLDKFVQTIASRQLEEVALKKLEELQKTLNAITC